jgi:hypothetical protein
MLEHVLNLAKKLNSNIRFYIGISVSFSTEDCRANELRYLTFADKFMCLENNYF